MIETCRRRSNEIEIWGKFACQRLCVYFRNRADDESIGMRKFRAKADIRIVKRKVGDGGEVVL